MLDNEHTGGTCWVMIVVEDLANGASINAGHGVGLVVPWYISSNIFNFSYSLMML
jgi:hypothetical protein